MSYATSVIKSIQQGTVSISAGNVASGTATITSVTTGKSFVNYLGFASSGNSGSAPQIDNWRVSLTNSTTVTVNRSSSDNSGALTCGFVVVEHY
jgi:hypothetical protein